MKSISQKLSNPLRKNIFLSLFDAWKHEKKSWTMTDHERSVESLKKSNVDTLQNP